MSVAPRLTERLLEALCPPSHFRDGILGDLSEEYIRRRSIRGPLAARAWYYGQALASAPHLVAHWASRATFGAWLGLAALGLGAMIAFQVAIIVVQTVTLVLMGWGLPDTLSIMYAAWRDAGELYPHMTEFLMYVPWLVEVFAGYLIGRYYREAPIAGAGAAAIIASAIAVAWIRSQGLPFMVQFWFNLALWTFCMTAGAAIAALTTRATADHYQFD